MGKVQGGEPEQERHEQIALTPPRNMSKTESDDVIRSSSIPSVKHTAEAVEIAKTGGWEVDALIAEMEAEVQSQGYKKGLFDVEFKNPKHFTTLLVVFASM